MNYIYLIKDSYLVEMEDDQINFLWTFKDLKNNDFENDYIEKNKWMDEIFNSLFEENLTHEEAHTSFLRSRKHLMREQPHIIEN